MWYICLEPPWPQENQWWSTERKDNSFSVRVYDHLAMFLNMLLTLTGNNGQKRSPTSYHGRYEHFRAGWPIENHNWHEGHLVAHMLATLTKSWSGLGSSNKSTLLFLHNLRWIRVKSSSNKEFCWAPCWICTANSEMSSHVQRSHTVSFAGYDHSLYSTRQTETETHACASCMRIWSSLSRIIA